MHYESVNPAVRICDTCASVPWIGLLTEELEGYPHKANLEELIASSNSCSFCALVLHAAVSNYRRSLDLGEENYRWRRFEPVMLGDDPESEGVRKTVYKKELGMCKPAEESDLCKYRGGYFTPVNMKDCPFDWQFAETMFIGTIEMSNADGKASDEEEPIDLEDLRRKISRDHRV
jgi:hypothetical protein